MGKISSVSEVTHRYCAVCVVWAMHGNVHHYIPAEVCELLCCTWEEHSMFCHRKELILKESSFLCVLDIPKSEGQKRGVCLLFQI